MWILANAGPVPIEAKLFIALTMLGLVAILMRWRERGPNSHWSFWRNTAIAFTVVVVLGWDWLVPPRNSFDSDLGIPAALVGAVSGAMFLRPKAKRSVNERWPARPMWFALLALISGPILGLLLALLVIFLSDVSPLDRTYTLTVFVIVGTVAGFIGAWVVALSTALSEPSQSSESPKTADQN